MSEAPFSFPSRALLDRLAPCVAVPGVPDIVAHQAPGVFALWVAWEDECGHEQQPPFWATAWPAATVLAHRILAGGIDVSARRVLEIACGGALVAIAAAKAGASAVEANDIDPVALHVAQLNALANAAALRCTGTDYVSGPLPEVDLICVADFFYERVTSEALLQRLVASSERGTEVVIADSGRPFAPREAMQVFHRESVQVDADLEGAMLREVTLSRLLSAGTVDRSPSATPER